MKALEEVIRIMDQLDEARAEAARLREAMRSVLAEIDQCLVCNYRHSTIEAAADTLRAALGERKGDSTTSGRS